MRIRTLWLFGRDQTVIGRHIANVFKDWSAKQYVRILHILPRTETYQVQRFNPGARTYCP